MLTLGSLEFKKLHVKRNFEDDIISFKLLILRISLWKLRKNASFVINCAMCTKGSSYCTFEQGLPRMGSAWTTVWLIRVIFQQLFQPKLRVWQLLLLQYIINLLIVKRGLKFILNNECQSLKQFFDKIIAKDTFLVISSKIWSRCVMFHLASDLMHWPGRSHFRINVNFKITRMISQKRVWKCIFEFFLIL